MSPPNQKIFAVIGAGPKGIAVAVKAKVLAEFGFPTDHVVLIEKNDIAANWSGNFGYTNGEMQLGTSPEKDVVFPIETNMGDPVINARIHERLLHFTWTSFLVHTGCYAEWVDRGRHSPCHKLWANYLRWVATQLEPAVSIIFSEVTKIDITENTHRWQLSLKNNTFIEADRLMLTGPGKIQKNFIKKNDTILKPPIYDLESFWHALKYKKFPTTEKIAIIGAGENAASMLLALSAYSEKSHIEVISQNGFLLSRAENYYENRLFSNPDQYHWHDFTLDDRMDFIKKTDLGVFSQHAMRILNEQKQHHIIPGRVLALEKQKNEVILTIRYGKKTTLHRYQHVILATGFNQITTLKNLMTQQAQKKLKKTLGGPINQKIISSKIQHDLSIEKMHPKLHLPMLSMRQGPGFSNLSCLGLLSDRLFVAR